MKKDAMILVACEISIHAPREGSDRADGMGQEEAKNFYPRSP